MDNYTMTKIVATLGPACATQEMIKKLFMAGVTMFRINSSHGDEEFHGQNLKYIREIEQEEHQLIPVLLDLQGPKIRIGNIGEPIELKKGEILKFRHQDTITDDILPVDYKGMANDVKIGELILIDDGKIQLEVQKVENEIIYAKVLTDGTLKPRKGINIPGSTGSIDVLTERDLRFVKFAVENDIDYLGLSFVRESDDVVKLREILKSYGREDIKIISKIEKPQAVNNIDAIIEVSDGIMVARGDLGIEISTEKVPIVQKTIIKKANVKHKVVIVATQMLESMIENPIPTRAETSDVANAILDGTDAIMLSGETAAGAYPVEAVQMMKKIADTVEDSPFMRKNKFPRKMIEEEKDNQAMALSMSIADMCKKMNVKAVMALTKSGITARFLSEGRLSVPIFACCPDKRICSSIKLYRGVFPVPMNFDGKIDKKTVKTIDKFIKRHMDNVSDGDTLIFTGSVPELLIGGTNFIKIHKVGSIK
uniref:pyruvate kinase n=1 Tax=Candidatus Scatousia sp. TaxID=3085663 RepID=UPI0040261B54